MLFRLISIDFTHIFSWAAFLLIGMWLGRQDVQNPKTRRNVFFGGVAIALVLECAPWLLLRCAIWLEFRRCSIFGMCLLAVDTLCSVGLVVSCLVLLFTLHVLFWLEVEVPLQSLEGASC